MLVGQLTLGEGILGAEFQRERQTGEQRFLAYNGKYKELYKPKASINILSCIC